MKYLKPENHSNKMETPCCFIGLWILYVACTCMSLCMADCPYKDCNCTLDTIDCYNKRFEDMPTLVSDNATGLTKLDMRFNFIRNIPEKSLPSNLTFIDFSFNPVDTISNGAFEGSAMTLETLYFSGDVFFYLPSELLNLTSLKAFRLLDSNIVDISKPDILSHLGKTLTTLEAETIGIYSWPQWLEKYFPHLTTLKLYNDFITTIPNEAFGQISDKLTTLTLVGSNFSHIPPVLSKLKNLEYLDFRNNLLTDSIVLPPLPNLKDLHLEYNNISNASHIANELTRYAKTLMQLDLSSNSLTSIPDLSQMKTLTKVDLSSNRIDDLNSGSFAQSVTRLILYGNNLSSVPSVVSKMPNLDVLLLNANSIQDINYTVIPSQITWLSLSNTEITKMNDDSFPPNSSLRTLHMGNIRLSNISPGAFKNLGNLETLDLSFSNLNRVPLALSSLGNLKTLNMIGNSNLICTCMESELVPWFQSHQDLEVTGNCGQIGIKDFFTILALECPQQNSTISTL